MTKSNGLKAVQDRVLAVLLGASILVTVAAVGAVAGFTAAKATSKPPPLSLPAIRTQAGFADLVSTVRPAVVNISTTHIDTKPALSPLGESAPLGSMMRQFFGPNAGQLFRDGQQPTHSLGSGFVIDPDGYIVTNNHVIADATAVRITLSDGTVLPASVVGRDAKTDLALLKVKADKPLAYVAFGDSAKERVGDWVVAVGNPYGLGGTVSAGVVSALDRDINHGPYDDYLQIDAPINPGNSGGPLFDQSGEVIGIDTAIFSPSGGSVGIGFAIPSNVARDVIAQLRVRGHVSRGWLGVQMQSITPELAIALGLTKPEGVLVDQVIKGSPADAAGVMQGDVITAFDDEAIISTRNLALAVADASSGKTAVLTVWRNGHDRRMRVMISSEPEQNVVSTGAKAGQGRLGLELAPLSPEGRRELGLDAGAVVAGVTPDSPAAASGVQPGDVILAVGTNKVSSLDDTIAQLRSAEEANKRAVLLLVSRDHAAVYIPIELGND